MNILIAFNSDSIKEAKFISDNLKLFNIDLINEYEPSQITVRSDLVKKCNVFIVVTSRSFQKNIYCMELLNYVKDIKKPFFAFNTKASFRPFGALGAIIIGLSKNGLVDLENINEKYFDELNQIFNEIKKNLKPNEIQINTTRPSTPNITINFENNDNTEIDVLVSHHSDTLEIAKIIEQGLKSKELKYKIEDCSVSNVKNAKCLVIIMSAGYEESNTCKSIIDKARSLNIPLIPVSYTRAWKPSSWLSLVISGKLFFRIIDHNQAFKPVYDSTPMNDLIFEILKSINPKPKNSERENILIAFLKSKIEECKLKLNKWPPMHKNRPKTELKPVLVDLKQNNLIIPPSNIEYTVTRIDFIPPPQLYDNHGVPIRKKFDCMISYQWKYQEMVSSIYMQLSVKNFTSWFDIRGYMEGSTNDSMATAIEDSAVLMIFLSKEYQQSDNCKLEFKYACSLGKPFIFILTEPDLTVESWIQPYFDQMPKFEIFKSEDKFIVDNNGWSRIDLISQAIREIGLAQSDISDMFELNEEIIELRETLNDALDEIDAQNKTNRFKTCSRCNKQYDENNVRGCKKHQAYFLGGTLIQPRWVCCDQHDQNSQGCLDTDHVDFKRVWTLNKQYGTYSWEPS
jgi:hypothetical protein